MSYNEFADNIYLLLLHTEHYTEILGAYKTKEKAADFVLRYGTITKEQIIEASEELNECGTYTVGDGTLYEIKKMTIND